MSEKTVQNEVNASHAASVGLIENVRLHVMWLVSFLTPPTGSGHFAPDMTTTHQEWWSTQRLLAFVRNESFGLFDSANPNRYRPNHPEGKTFGVNTAEMVWLPKPIVNALTEAARLKAEQMADFGRLWLPVRVQPGTVWFGVDEWASPHYDPMPLPDGTVEIMAEAYACIPEPMFDWKQVGGIHSLMTENQYHLRVDSLDLTDFWPEAPVSY